MRKALHEQMFSAVPPITDIRGGRVSSTSAEDGSTGNRKLRLGVEEMQTAELGREADLIAPHDRGLRGHAGNGNAMAADPGLEQDLGAELFDDFDAGIE